MGKNVCGEPVVFGLDSAPLSGKDTSSSDQSSFSVLSSSSWTLVLFARPEIQQVMHFLWFGNLFCCRWKTANTNEVLTARNRVRDGNVFSNVCLSFCLSTGGGVPHVTPHLTLKLVKLVTSSSSPYGDT